MTRIPRSPADEPALSHRLQWHAGQTLRRGVCCSVLVMQPLGQISHRRPSVSTADRGWSGSALSPLHQIADKLRPLLRRTDVVEVDDSTGIGILLFDADGDGVRAVHQRIYSALTTTPSSPSRFGRAVTCEDVHLAVGHATADPAEPIHLPTLVRDLVCAASTPSLRLSVPLPRMDERSIPRRRSRPAPHDMAMTLVASARRTTEREMHGIFPSDLTALTSNSEATELELRQRADVLGVPFVCLPSHVPPSLRRIVALELARDLCAVPIGRTRGVLTVAMRDPADSAAVQRLAAATGLTIFPVLAAERDLTGALEQLVKDITRPMRTVDPVQV